MFNKKKEDLGIVMAKNPRHAYFIAKKEGLTRDINELTNSLELSKDMLSVVEKKLKEY